MLQCIPLGQLRPSALYDVSRCPLITLRGHWYRMLLNVFKQIKTKIETKRNVQTQGGVKMFWCLLHFPDCKQKLPQMDEFYSSVTLQQGTNRAPVTPTALNSVHGVRFVRLSDTLGQKNNFIADGSGGTRRSRTARCVTLAMHIWPAAAETISVNLNIWPRRGNTFIGDI